MSNSINWQNPYDCCGNLWLKGNLHVHTTRSEDGKIPLDEVIKLYENMDYSFIALTDHNTITDPTIYDSSISLLAGIEVDIENANHTCIINPDKTEIIVENFHSHQDLLNKNYNKGNLVVLNHPDFGIKGHYTIKYLNNMESFTGIEIYNSKIEGEDGSPVSTAKWDSLLSLGKMILGFASQDLHDETDLKDCCNVVKVQTKDIKVIFNALRKGNFYCFYGVEITDIGRDKNTIYVNSSNADLIRFLGSGGRILKEVHGKKAKINFLDEAKYKYIRVECLGHGKDISWSQPFFRD